ncbi:MAG: arrestin C-terminal domain-containing protein, partial [Planctomycetes bacterium]|nr:arrestin C-terminal domain-containing protein [Planctomycetota bacterium]
SELVRTRYPEDQGKGLLDAWFGPDVRVEAALPQSVFRPGDVIDGVFRVDAPQPLECRKIIARLLGVERTEAGGHKDTHSHQGSPTVLATPGGIERSHKQDFQIPALLEGPATSQGKLFTIDWYVQLELDVPWAKDPKVRIPITLLGE